MKQLNRVPFPTDVDLWFTSEINFPSVANALTCKAKLEELCGHEVTMTPADGGGVHLEGAFDLGAFNKEEDHGLAKIVSLFTNLQEIMFLKFIYIDSSGYFGGQVGKYCLQTGAELECFGLNECFENEDLPVRKEDITKQPEGEQRVLYINRNHPAIKAEGDVQSFQKYIQFKLSTGAFDWNDLERYLNTFSTQAKNSQEGFFELDSLEGYLIKSFEYKLVDAILLTK